MKALNFQDDIPLIPIHSFQNHYLLLFDLTSMKNGTGICHYPELVGELLRLELNFIYPLKHVTKLFVLGERMYSVAVNKFGLFGKITLKEYRFSPANPQSFSAIQVSVHCFISF